MTTLDTLPNEILSLVTSHLDRPRDVLHLALSCRRLSAFARLDGWKAFLKGRFGVSGLDSDARNAVHGLTTTYRNWHRRGFIAKYLEPSPMTKSINTWQSTRWRGPRGQTMGYQPSIDSYEEMFGSWAERKEVLAWSAGTQVVFRVKETGRSARQERHDSERSTTTLDTFKHSSSWWTYKIPDSLEGRDDITSLKLLRPHQLQTKSEDVVFGTASGQLSLLSFDAQQEEHWIQQYDTAGETVGSISVSPCKSPVLAATLGDSALALYPIEYEGSQDLIEPISRVSPFAPEARHGRIWSCNFLSDDKVAIGMGPTHEPIHIYKVAPGGLLSRPIRTFNLDSKSRKETSLDRSVPRSTSVYPILPIPGTAQGGSGAGNVFLSGGYDGIIRLHDLRSDRGFETMFWDQTNDSSIYSLATQGLEHIVAGVSMHSMIKVFDLRLSGSHAYHTVSLAPRLKNKPKSQDFTYNAVVNDTKGSAAVVSGGWNLYLNPRIPPKRNAYREDYWRGGQDSPVYSLSIPSATSPNVYAGLEGVVQSLAFHSTVDPYPDTLHSQSTVRFAASGAVDVRSSYDLQGDALNLGMYEQSNEEGLRMQLLVQGDVGTDRLPGSASKLNGLDERWKDLTTEDERWSRGSAPPTPNRGRGGRGHGRGRGRGGRARGRGATGAANRGG
jgi:WD40 repeat protein